MATLSSLLSMGFIQTGLLVDVDVCRPATCSWEIPMDQQQIPCRLRARQDVASCNINNLLPLKSWLQTTFCKGLSWSNWGHWQNYCACSIPFAQLLACLFFLCPKRLTSPDLCKALSAVIELNTGQRCLSHVWHCVGCIWYRLGKSIS